MPEIICLFHDDCFDGLGAAWALSKRFPDAELIPVNYRQPPPKFPLDKIVYILDFCYPLEDLIQIATVAEELHVFDHHIGVKDVIEKYNDFVHATGLDKTKFEGVFDNERSGALLTWELLMPEYEVPGVIRNISDRDLWKFELPETNAVMAGLGTYKLSREVWDRIFRWDENYRAGDENHPHVLALNQLEDDGHVILRKTRTDVDRIIQLTVRDIALGGFVVPLVNVPRFLVSETLSQLALGKEFAVGYFDTKEYREFSLRSSPDGVSVLEIAKSFGGGGHKHAAGFKVRRNHPLANF